MPKEKQTKRIIKKKSSSDQELLSILSLTNWKLKNNTEQRAFVKAFSNKEERLEFMQNFYLYKKTVASIYSEIETSLPRDRKNPKYYEAKEFKEKVLSEPKKGNEFDISRLNELILELEDEIDDSEEEKEVEESKESEEQEVEKE